MSQTVFARRHGRGLTYVALGMSFILSVPPNSYAGQDVAQAQDPQAQSGEKEAAGSQAVAEEVVAPESAVATPAEPLAIVGNSPRCAEAANSPLAEPEWFLDECLGGVRPTSAGAPAPASENMVPGDLFYLHNIRAAGTPPSSLYTAPIPTYTFTTIGSNNLPIFAMDFDLPATTLWGINNTTRGLGTYNLTTGAFTQTVVTTGIPAAETISGLKFDPTSSLVYVNTTLKLFTIDLTTGVCTLVGPFTHAAPAVIEIAISATGQMYGTDITSDSLYSINKTTGASTLIGPLGVNLSFAQGMDFDWSDGTLYQFAYIGAGVNDLRRINTTTGASTLILNGPVGPEHEGATKVAFAPPGPSQVFIDEVEPNDSVATAQAIPGTPIRIRSNLYKVPFTTATFDNDFFSFTAPANSRVSIASGPGFSPASTDTVIDVLASDGTTVIESDDDDGPIGNSSNLGGVPLTAGGTYYIRVKPFSTTPVLSSTIRPYDLYVTVTTGTPVVEVEPNPLATPMALPASGWVSGVIDVAGDVDAFSVAVNAGDTIIAILDADPERDAPEWNPRLAIGNFNNTRIIVNGSAVGGTFDDINPSEAFMETVKTTGTYVVSVDEVAAGGAANFTYNLLVKVIPARARTGCAVFTGTAGAITDAGITDFTLNIPNSTPADYLRLTVTATHPATADLDVSLISPDGNEAVLFNDMTTATGAAPQINFVIEDEASLQANFVGVTSGVHSGMHHTPQPVASGRMDFFKGMQAQGTWTLRVRDDLAGNAGTLDAWSLDVCPPAPRPACIAPGPQENTVYSSDFEANDGGFTHAGTGDEWERGLPTFAPITTAHSGTNAWKTDLDNTYNASANFELLSPSMNLTNVTGRITLNWWQKFQMDTASNDTYWVEVRPVGNPAAARRVFSWLGGVMTRAVGTPAVTVNQSAGWGAVQADISSFAGQNVQVVFHLESNATTQLAGIAVDDVLVTSCAAIVGQAIADLSITKTDNQTTYFPGQVLTYTIVATNAGPSPVVDAVVADAFPAELTNVSWTCIASAGSNCAASGTGDINDTIDLLSGGTATYTATATVSQTATGPLANSATIASPGSVPDPNTANNSATDTDQFLASAPFGLAVDTAGNSVYQPNETVVVAPSWRNLGASAATFTGTFSNHTGPVGPTYTIPDAAADYGSIAGGANGSCTATGNCYSVANSTATRPGTHWDTTVVETIAPASGSPKTWTLHVGNSFTDVPPTSGFYRFIEILLHRPITGGCSPTTYCPSSSTTREQMAVFVLLSKEAPGYTPAACVAGSEAFADVPASSPFCRWVEELARRGVVSGCGGGNYCPTAAVTREQMAVFVLRTLDPALNPPACVPPNLYLDVPETSGFCRWIEELTNRGVVSGCGGGNYCPANPVTREQMGVFLSVTFGLTLYGL